jgi:hypothetical protein
MNPVGTDFYSNTVVFSDMSGATSGLIHYNGAGNTAGVATSNKYYNNIFYLPTTVSTPNSGIMFWFNGTNNRAVDRLAVCNWNCWGRDSSKIKLCDSTGTYTTKSAWQTATGFDANSIIADPLFVNTTGSSPSDFRLKVGSPCATAGRLSGLISGLLVEIGAWRGATQIGSNLLGVRPVAPQVSVS